MSVDLITPVTLSTTAAQTVGSLTVTGATTTTGGIVYPATAPAAGRGIIVQLGKLAALNLNAVAATTIVTTPGAGFTRAVIDFALLDNFSGAPTTNALSIGASATPTDWVAATVLAAGAGVGKGLYLYPAVNTAFAVYGTTIAIVANVTVGGAAITCDINLWGYYE